MTMLAGVLVRMTTSMVGQPTLDVGEVVSMPLRQAQQWVAAGIAEWFDDPLEIAARRGAPERAMRPRGKARA